MGWTWRGLRRGVLSSGYPRRQDGMPPGYRGAVEALDCDEAEQRRGAQVCPVAAIEPRVKRAAVDPLRCIQCGLCAAAAPKAFALSNAFELARRPTPQRVRDIRPLMRSLHIRHVDTGSDGSEEQELQAMFNPYYDANRLGIFLTASPRHADALVVTGPVTFPMLEPLKRAYETMPDPKLVVALGTSACSGSMYDRDAVAGPVSRILPVDVYIPGSPPAPLTILHGILMAVGRRQERQAL